MTEGGTGGAASYGIVVSISIPVQADLPTDLDMLYHDDASRARPVLLWGAGLVLYRREGSPRCLIRTYIVQPAQCAFRNDGT